MLNLKAAHATSDCTRRKRGVRTYYLTNPTCDIFCKCTANTCSSTGYNYFLFISTNCKFLISIFISALFGMNALAYLGV